MIFILYYQHSLIKSQSSILKIYQKHLLTTFKKYMRSKTASFQPHISRLKEISKIYAQKPFQLHYPHLTFRKSKNVQLQLAQFHLQLKHSTIISAMLLSETSILLYSKANDLLMNKIKTLYPTEVDLPEKHPLKDTYNHFSKRLDDHIKHAIILKKSQHLRQSTQMMQQLTRIRDRSNKYKKKLYEQQKQFQEKVENLIMYDIRKYQQYQLFFKTHFEALEDKITQLRNNNKKYKLLIEKKKEELKTVRKQSLNFQLLTAKNTSQRNTTKESSVRFTYSQTSKKKLKTEPSLPVLKSNRYERIKTIQSQYEDSPPRQDKLKKKRSLSYMDPIGSIRSKQPSSLKFLGQLLSWYRARQSSESNWLKKVLFTPRNYSRLQQYIALHSGDRKVQYHQ